MWQKFIEYIWLLYNMDYYIFNMATPLVVGYEIIYTSKYANIQYRITIQSINNLPSLFIN